MKFIIVLTLIFFSMLSVTASGGLILSTLLVLFVGIILLDFIAYFALPHNIIVFHEAFCTLNVQCPSFNIYSLFSIHFHYVRCYQLSSHNSMFESICWLYAYTIVVSNDFTCAYMVMRCLSCTHTIYVIVSDQAVQQSTFSLLWWMVESMQSTMTTVVELVVGMHFLFYSTHSLYIHTANSYKYHESINYGTLISK